MHDNLKTTEVILIDGRQVVTLPDEFHFTDAILSIRKHGEGVILEPVKSRDWPTGFFDDIHIEDPTFSRSPQGETPHVPAIDGE